LADKKETKKQNAIVRSYRETVGELRKVSWPSREETIYLTFVVIIVLLSMAIALGLVDAGAHWVLRTVLLGIKE
jgi:preprotein translocase subunit SecE